MQSRPPIYSRHRVTAGLCLVFAGILFFPLHDLQAQTSPADSAGPVIALWTSKEMTFGTQGVPQPVVNILGNVSSSRGVASLHYSLNGGSFLPLSIGPDLRRLVRPGDFNLDINPSLLTKWPQVNIVTIAATDSQGHLSSVNVRLADHSPSRWTLPYEVAWTSPATLEDSAQVVDGKWSWTPGGIVPAEDGYDRLVAIGDTGWTDYEVTAEITVVDIDTSGTAYDQINGGPAIGLLMHWNGHTNTPLFSPPITQPRSGYLPLGAIGWYHWRRGAPSGWELLGNNLRIMGSDTVQGLDVGVRYVYKMRVATVSGFGQAYYLKYWKASSVEPPEWQLMGLEDTTNPQHGSCLLLAHHVKALFGKVSITPLGREIAVTDIEVLTSPNSAYVTWKTNARSTGRVLYGKTLASPDTSREKDFLSMVHQALLPDLNPSTQYQVKIEAIAEEGTAIRPAQGGFTTSKSQPALAFKSDLFDGTTIDSSRWVFINTDPPSTLSKLSQSVSIEIPSGSGHDIWSGMNAPRIMQPATNMDFQAEAKFLSVPNLAFQLEGILVQQDVDDFMRFDFVSDSLGVSAFAASFEGGVPTVRGNVRILAQSPMFLRVTRTGSTWKSFFSHDSVNWTVSSTFTSPMRLNAIGLFSGNAPGQNSTAPAFTGVIDHFINLVEKASDVTPLPAAVPQSFALEQNYPNPFNPLTVIKYTVGVAGSQGQVASVRLVVYDLLGREVATLVNERQAPGAYEVRFDASGLASGVYLCRMTAGAFTQTRKLTLLR